MALPLLNVIVPVNIIVVQKVIENIVNFQILPKEKLYDMFAAPILGEKESKEKNEESESNVQRKFQG